MNPILEVEELVVDIPVASGVLHPVRGITFCIERGQTLCIVGESGCGKSLAMLAIMGLLPKTASRSAKHLDFERKSLQSLPEREMANIRGNKISMIFQDPMTTLNPSYTIGNQLLEPIFRHRPHMSRLEARTRSIFLLNKVGIPAEESRFRQYPHQLSGGLRQRVMIAMALMCQPDLLIADEPTTALDVTIQAQILWLINNLKKEFNIGVILITHDLSIAARIADRVAVMYAGQIIETGTAKEIFGQPLHPYTEGLLGCIPIPGKTNTDQDLGSIPGIVPNLIGNLIGCTFRDRCVYMHEKCTENIAMHHLGAGRAYRCILSPEIEVRKPTRLTNHRASNAGKTL